MTELTNEEEEFLQYQNYLQLLYEERDLKKRALCLYHRVVPFATEHFYIEDKKYDYETTARIPVIKLKHDFHQNRCRNCGEIENPHLNRPSSTPQREYHRIKN